MRHLQRRALAAAGLTVAAIALAALAAGGLTGVDRLWPVLVGAAVGFAPGPAAGRAAALLLGVGVGWIGVVLRLAVLPDTLGGRAVAGALVLAALVAVSVATRDRVPLWAALVGAAGFLALADAALAVDPTGFAADRLGALGTMLLGAGLGLASAVAARALLTVGIVGARPHADAEERPARAEPSQEER